jgi:hypothetical protein
MAYSTRQEKQILIGAYVYNGGYRAFKTYPVSIDVWNVRANAELEFMGSAVTQTLTGREYSNSEGYRLLLDFDVNNVYDSADQLAWRTLFGLFSNLSNRTFWTTTANGAGVASTSLILQSDAPTVNDYFNGMIVSNLSGGAVVITDYDGATRTATLASAKSWSNADAITIQARPNLPTLLGVAINNEAGDLIYYNIDGNGYGILREFTIGKQQIGIKARSFERTETIPESFVNYG